ncbi:MAG: hypothetical protein GKR88_11155 [Flavobacteriaceae bacterium]|nr:MAG: hypothetical protein GKR88_11155 [Flavobacteriaceae bacterium]
MGEYTYKMSDKIKVAIAISAPVDLASCGKEMSKPKNKIYESIFENTAVESLTEKSKVS